MNRPLIGISGSLRAYGGAERAGVNAAYVRSIAQAGGVPIILTPAIDPEDTARALAPLDGLVLTGGHDVDPGFYRGKPSPALGPLDPQRDAFELALFHSARARRMPILGICRGLQLVNVGMGGTLWQDLPSEKPGEVDHNASVARDARTHAVAIRRGSQLWRALDTGQLLTNSFHHQAIRDLAPGLTVTAQAEDGIVEGVETQPGDGWLLAVQWHPEEFHREPNSPDQKLFEALVGAALRREEPNAARPRAETARGRSPG